MKVSISGDAKLVSLLSERTYQDVAVESVSISPDKTEQKFGLAEVATAIAIAKGAAELTNAIIDLWQERRKGKAQTLRVKSALGSESVQLDDRVNRESLQRQLSSLFPE